MIVSTGREANDTNCAILGFHLYVNQLLEVPFVGEEIWGLHLRSCDLLVVGTG